MSYQDEIDNAEGGAVVIAIAACCVLAALIAVACIVFL